MPDTHETLAGKLDVNFTIAQTSLADGSVVLGGVPAGGYAYNGSGQEPAAITVKTKDGRTVDPSEYSVIYSNSNGGEGNTINAGTVTVTVTAKANGNCTGGPPTASYTIKQAQIKPDMILWSAATVEYDRQEHKPIVMITRDGNALQENQDYRVVYSRDSGETTTTDFTSAGVITVTVSGTGNYTGGGSKTFTIRQKAISATATVQEKVYDGTTDAEVTFSFASGDVIAGDTVTITASGSKFDTKDAGDGKTVTIGTTIKAGARSYDRIPYSVMDALDKAENVTLHITWNGGEDIVIHSSQALKPEANRIYYPLSYLADLDFTMKGQADPAKLNPETGGILEIAAPAAADTITNAAGQPEEITHPQRGLAETPELAEKGIEKAIPGVYEPGTTPADSPAQPSGKSSASILLVAAALLLTAAAGGFWFWKKKTAQ